MSDKLQEGLAELLQMLISGLKQGGDFLAEQTPIVIQELITWLIVKHSLGILLGVLFALVAFKVIKVLLKDRKEHETFYKIEYGDSLRTRPLGDLTWSGFWILSLASFIFISINVYQLIFILVAPRIYLIEYIKNFL